MASFIRFEVPTDAHAIRAVHVASFPTRYEASVVDELRIAGRLSVSLVAEDEGRVVGHVALSPLEQRGGFGLGPLAVLQEFRRAGVGAALVRRGLLDCRAAGAGFVVVLGDPKYYARFGFAPASGWRLRSEFGGDEAFQALEFKPKSIPDEARLIRYAPEFGSPEAISRRCPRCGYHRYGAYSEACPECGSMEGSKK